MIEIHGHHVPQLIDFDDELLVIEMTIVQAPYLLDFAGAHLDAAPDFPEDRIDWWHEKMLEEFGQHYGDVLSVIDGLRKRAGIYMLDVHPDNIAFDEEGGDT